MREQASFEYDGYGFLCEAVADGRGQYTPRVACASGPQIAAPEVIPADTGAYASVAEALRHCEQQAERWVHRRRA